MSNAAFLFKKIIDLGKDIALNESQPFSEEQVLADNMIFLFENLP